MTDQERLGNIESWLGRAYDTFGVDDPTLKDIAWLVGEVERLQGLLARLEWTRGPRPRCPACDGWHPNGPGGRGHHPACWLAQELGR